MIHTGDFIFAVVSMLLIGFGIGREWQRVFSKPRDDCPFGAECGACHQPNPAAFTSYHYRIDYPGAKVI